MFSNIKTYLYVGIIILIGSVLFGLNHYYEKSKTLADNLKASNQMALDLGEVIKKKDLKIKSIKDDVNRQAGKITELSKKANDYKNEADEISKKYNAERLNKIGNAKPKLLEKVFNNAIKKEVNDFNELTKNKR